MFRVYFLMKVNQDFALDSCNSLSAINALHNNLGDGRWVSAEPRKGHFLSDIYQKRN